MGLQAWVAGKAVGRLLTALKIQKPFRKKITKTVKQMLNGKRVMQREPVMVGGVLTILATLGASQGLENVSADDLAVVVATCVAVVSFVQRRVVKPVKVRKKRRSENGLS